MRWYDVPQGRIGSRFVQRLAAELKEVRTRGLNSQCPLVFAAVVLPMAENARSSKDIHACIERRMDLWDQSRFATLADDTVNARWGRKRRTVPGRLYGGTRGACGAGL